MLLCGFLIAQTPKVPLNSTTLEELQELPIPGDIAEAVYDYVLYQGPVTNIYSLGSIPGVTAEYLEILKTHVTTSEKKVKGVNRLMEFSRSVENFTGTEGVNEGLVEMWLDRLAEPMNINDATYDDLIALQNVSPVDAVAVLKRLDEGELSYPRALRTALGLSYYGYRNMRDFFVYGSDTTAKSNHFWYNTTYKTIPSTNSFDSEVSSGDPLSYHPADVQHKVLFSYGEHWKFGMIYYRGMGESTLSESDQNGLFPSIKISASLNDVDAGVVNFDRIILGSFSVTMGQGVVFESTDFFAPRRSGYGWSRRVVGAFPDASRSHEYALNGVATQTRIGPFQAIGFISKTPRDAIINPIDKSISTLISLYPRIDVGYFGDLPFPMLNTVEEMTYGTHIRYFHQRDLILGFSAYESLYDRVLDPQIRKTIIHPDNQWRYLTSIGNTADTEIDAMYLSEGSSPLWDKAKSFRRVVGMDFTKVISNIAFQGEIGLLDKDGDMTTFSKDPQAKVLSGYMQFDNLNILVLYRDYDLGFDNPYQRSFSNYQRYKGSIFEDTFYLTDPIYGFLYTGIAQPQAERGIYFSSRYQFHQQFVVTTDFDTWTRVADNARYYRTVIRLQYRPTFNYRINIRQKWQERGAFDSFDPSAFYSRETILRFQMRLSNYDQLELIYGRSAVDFTARRRLSADYESGGQNLALVGNKNSLGQSVGFRVIHHFQNNSRISFHTLFYQGFVWSFEETDFRVFDSLSDAVRYYVAYSSRLGQNWMLRLKWTNDIQLPITNYYYADSESASMYDRSLQDIYPITQNSDVRVQIDYTF